MERLPLPGTQEWAMHFADHVARYSFAAPYTLGKTIVDAGTGIGYGAAAGIRTSRAAIGVAGSWVLYVMGQAVLAWRLTKGYWVFYVVLFWTAILLLILQRRLRVDGVDQPGPIDGERVLGERDGGRQHGRADENNECP